MDSTPSDASGDSTVTQREQTAAMLRALEDNRPLAVEEALDLGLPGWNLRCTRCGSYGAEWVPVRSGGATGQRPLCPGHRDQVRAEMRRHERAMAVLTAETYAQEPAEQVNRRWRAHRKARRADRPSG